MGETKLAFAFEGNGVEVETFKKVAGGERVCED
jgi:hypothetical protein